MGPPGGLIIPVFELNRIPNKKKVLLRLGSPSLRSVSAVDPDVPLAVGGKKPDLLQCMIQIIRRPLEGDGRESDVNVLASEPRHVIIAWAESTVSDWDLPQDRCVREWPVLEGYFRSAAIYPSLDSCS